MGALVEAGLIGGRGARAMEASPRSMLMRRSVIGFHFAQQTRVTLG